MSRALSGNTHRATPTRPAAYNLFTAGDCGTVLVAVGVTFGVEAGLTVGALTTGGDDVVVAHPAPTASTTRPIPQRIISSRAQPGR
ncbi:hypothetical protein GCM10009534_34420 [Kribbella sandramycini]